jgi:IS5 family transposase
MLRVHLMQQLYGRHPFATGDVAMEEALSPRGLPAGRMTPLYSEFGDETNVFADASYQGVGKRDATQDIASHWHVAMRPSKRQFGLRKVHYRGLMKNTQQLHKPLALSNL